MTEPTVPRPVPGPYRPGPRPAPVAGPGAASSPAAAARGDADAPRTDAEPDRAGATDGPTASGADARGGLTGLGELPVAEHVAVFESEHARLQRELGTIDPR
ncbi:hypothetical protein [Blastococcus sp. SYSU DS0539]